MALGRHQSELDPVNDDFDVFGMAGILLFLFLNRSHRPSAFGDANVTPARSASDAEVT